MNDNAVQTREGFVQVRRGYHDSMVLVGLNVSGGMVNGVKKNRVVLISREAPTWFQALCWRYCDTSMKFRVRIVAVYKDNVAYAVPTALSEEQAIQDYRSHYGAMLAENDDFSEIPSKEIIEYATKAHELYAAEKNLTVVQHTLRGNSMVITIAKNSRGDVCMIKGGFIVGKMKKHIDTGAVTFEDQVKRFVYTTAEK